MFRTLFLAFSLSLCSFSARSATLDVVEVVPGAPTIAGVQIPSPTIVNPDLSLLFTGIGTLSTDPTNSSLLLTSVPNVFSVLASPSVVSPFQGISGSLIDRSFNGGTLLHLYRSDPLSASEFGELFRVSLTDVALFGLQAPFSFPVETIAASVTIEAVTPIPVPAALPLLLGGLAGLALLRRRRSRRLA